MTPRATMSGSLKLRGLEWKLAELEVHIVGTPIRLTGQAL